MVAIYILLLSLIHIYCYALPTFLLLAYPTKVIAIVVYLITFIFSTSAICSIIIRFVRKSHGTFGCNWICCCMSINLCLALAYPMMLFVVMIQFLYALVLSQASAITSGPYTIFSLIPSAVVSVVTWMVKNKVFGKNKDEDDNSEEKNEPSQQQEASHNEQQEAGDNEHPDDQIPLVAKATDDSKHCDTTKYGSTATV